jgi:hypothetical protein
MTASLDMVGGMMRISHFRGQEGFGYDLRPFYINTRGLNKYSANC